MYDNRKLTGDAQTVLLVVIGDVGQYAGVDVSCRITSDGQHTSSPIKLEKNNT